MLIVSFSLRLLFQFHMFSWLWLNLSAAVRLGVRDVAIRTMGGEGSRRWRSPEAHASPAPPPTLHKTPDNQALLGRIVRWWPHWQWNYFERINRFAQNADAEVLASGAGCSGNTAALLPYKSCGNSARCHVASLHTMASHLLCCYIFKLYNRNQRQKHMNVKNLTKDIKVNVICGA